MHLPGPIRAAVGIAATAADEVKKLPDRAIELPMLAVGTALQMSLRAQQRYARLAARGDEVLNPHETRDEPPEWATFDDPVSDDELHRAALAQLDSLGSVLGVEDPDTSAVDGTVTPISRKTAQKRPAAKRPATKRPATKRPASKATATGGGKSVSKPRHTAPSKFDDADGGTEPSDPDRD